MSDEIFAALIGALASVVGSIISALTTIATVWIKEKQRASCGLFLTMTAIGGIAGFVLGFIITFGIRSLSAIPMRAPTPTTTMAATTASPLPMPTSTATLPLTLPSPTGVILFTPTFPPLDTENLVINGSFVDGFTGWERTLIDQGGHSETKIIPFQSGRYGRALLLSHTGPGGVYFTQTIDVPHTRLDFYVTFRSKVETSLFGDPAGITEVILVYLDIQGNELGRIRIINFSKGIFTDVPCLGCPQSPQSSNTESINQVENNRLYIDYHINLHTHLTQELLGVPPNQVRKIAILLAVGTTATESTSLKAELLVTDLRLYPQE